jgi:hypothetical protein
MLAENNSDNSNKTVTKLVSSPNVTGVHETNKRSSVGSLHNEFAKLVIIMKEGGEGASLDIASDITIGRYKDPDIKQCIQ